MNFIYTNIKWIMVIAGLLTCSMIFAVFAPEAALISMFGETLTEPLAQIIVRSWGFLIFLMGTLLIYGAYNPEYRNLTLVIAGISKLAFITIIVIYGPQYIEKSTITIILDSVLVITFMTYLIKLKNVNEQIKNT
ncbi:MAG: hypothetical protein HRT53_02280 [Colwellia sp.]|nr:hypothetical protein [Colwellia sp.]